MRCLFAGVVATFALVVAGAGRAQACDSTMQQPAVRQLMGALDRVAAVGPVWDDYDPGNHPVVLLAQDRDTTHAVCAAVWRRGREPIVLPVGQRIRLMTALYGLWDGDPPGPHPVVGNGDIAATMTTIPPELERAIRSTGNSRAVVLLAPVRFDELGALGRALAAMHADPVVLGTQLVVHEGYHLHSQIPVWLDQSHRYAWPRWDVQPDRKQLVGRCYGGSPAVEAAVRDETTALLAAWDLLSSERSPSRDSLAREKARSFIALRRARYALVDSMRVGSPTGPESCERAENTMELEEGAPQWIAYETAVRAGVMSLDGAGRSSNENFYTTGVFQLWIMERLLGNERVRELSSRLTRAESPTAPTGSIFAAFEATIGDQR
jgi:hypothetical protein